MNSKNGHHRILLNKNASGRVDYCAGCDVVELEVGPISLRLRAEDMTQFSALIKEAELRLHYCRLEQAKQDAELMRMEGVH